jgi:hypothetical protein
MNTKFLQGSMKKRSLLGRLKIHLKEIGFEGAKWIHLAWDDDQ